MLTSSIAMEAFILRPPYSPSWSVNLDSKSQCQWSVTIIVVINYYYIWTVINFTCLASENTWVWKSHLQLWLPSGFCLRTCLLSAVSLWMGVITSRSPVTSRLLERSNILCQMLTLQSRYFIYLPVGYFYVRRSNSIHRSLISSLFFSHCAVLSFMIMFCVAQPNTRSPTQKVPRLLEIFFLLQPVYAQPTAFTASPINQVAIILVYANPRYSLNNKRGFKLISSPQTMFFFNQWSTGAMVFFQINLK